MLASRCASIRLIATTPWSPHSSPRAPPLRFDLSLRDFRPVNCESQGIDDYHRLVLAQ